MNVFFFFFCHQIKSEQSCFALNEMYKSVKEVKTQKELPTSLNSVTLSHLILAPSLHLLSVHLGNFCQRGLTRSATQRETRNQSIEKWK